MVGITHAFLALAPGMDHCADADDLCFAQNFGKNTPEKQQYLRTLSEAAGTIKEAGVTAEMGAISMALLEALARAFGTTLCYLS
jgi:hypothetical protein